MSKNTTKQFLLSIKPKYRNSVPVILEEKKKTKEASEWVCQAILEKYAREQAELANQIPLEKQIEEMLQSQGVVVAESSKQTEASSEIKYSPNLKPVQLASSSKEKKNLVKPETIEPTALETKPVEKEKDEEPEIPVKEEAPVQTEKPQEQEAFNQEPSEQESEQESEHKPEQEESEPSSESSSETKDTTVWNVPKEPTVKPSPANPPKRGKRLIDDMLNIK